MQALSPTGRCHTFDKKADGYVPGEGVVSILIKPLSKAIADGNKIHGVIKGSAINHVGRSNNPTSPRPELQTRLLTDAWKAAGINPEDISYIEAHGTGTGLGDPIEINALKRAFKTYTDKEGFCTIGSTKAHAGHLEAAAGLTSVIKVLLMMKHRTIPVMPNFEELNPYIKLDGSPFRINTNKEEWKSDRPFLAGISSFGMTGNNAHVVIEEYRAPKRQPYNSASLATILLSARSEDRLKTQAENLSIFLQSNAEVNIHDIAYTLQADREPMDERLAIVAKDKDELKAQLKSFLEGNADNLIKGNVKKDKLIDWSGYYPGDKPNKVSLPLYPFARERYWVPGSAVIDSSGKALTKEHLAELERVAVYTEAWQPMVFPAHEKRPGRVLILGGSAHRSIEGSNTSPGLIRQLEKAFDTITVVHRGETLSVDLKDVSGLIDLTPLENGEAMDYGWVALLQKLIEQSETSHIKMLIVSKEWGEHLGGAERFGLYHMLQAEYAKVDSLHVHIAGDLPENEQADLIMQAYNSRLPYTKLSYLKGDWHHPVLKGHTLRGPAVVPVSYPVLITGGTRGIGMTCAKYLVVHHQVKKLILLGREELPHRSSWEERKIEDSSLGQKIRDILFLEQAGAEVRIINTPLSEKDSLKASLDEVRKVWGPVKGLLHCAGYADKDTPAFINKKVESIANLQMPKVSGLNHLHEALKDHALEFAVLFSSISALAPRLGAGFSDYTMANSYMDVFAAWQRTQGYNYTSIQWPSWKETGMGEVRGGIYEELGQLSITNKEAMSILDNVLLNAEMPAVIFPAVYDPAKFDKDSFLTVPGITPGPAAGRSVAVSNIGDWLKEQVGNVLNIQAGLLHPDTPLQEYGMDSIVLVMVIKRLEKQLDGASISPTVILENPTIALLSDYLKEHYPAQLAALLNAAVAEPAIDPTAVETALQTKVTTAPPGAATAADIPHPVRSSNGRIAVIGMACHFPDADNLAAYWENLRTGKDSIREVPASRWAIKEHYDSDGKAKGKSISKWGAFLHRIEDFDPVYFGISPLLAGLIDPLERQWLEVSVEAIADAGYKKEDIWGKRVGVYAGARASNFSDKIHKSHKDIIVGVGQNFITAHLAHIYNLKGPNMVIDTACSSSITAIDLAVKGLLSGETELALAGGVDILLDEKPYLTLSMAEVLSADGKCRTFDESANGIGLGEGCGVLLLRRLDDAIAAGDKIYGVIEGTAVNNDGNTMGVTTPNPEAQLSLMKDAIVRAGIDPSTISYIETHGTGTLIGDPIELKAITRLLEAHTSGKGICGVGSVKSNIGHLLSAAGVAGVIKTLLSITARQLPPTLHCENPNPRFDFANSPVYPVRQLQEWIGVDGIRRAGVSAFGLGGSNAHLIVSNAGIPEGHQVKPPFRPSVIDYKRQRYWPGEHLVMAAEEKVIQEKVTEEKAPEEKAFKKYLHFNIA